ncbi:MAG: LysM peptidoglycan-binding domain-containing protein [Deltaproteobacteria bacterium]|nr:LysM peptidoglycan-binding domain-containing protein [Deltaproteobacteria bacterium]
MAACLIWCWCVFQPFSAFAGVMYQKDYVVKHDLGNRIWCEPYVVQSNESLTRLFQEKGEIIDENLDEFLQIFKRLNPQVSDVETIRPGQQIFIPLKKLGPDQDSEHSGRIITLPMVTISGNKTQPASEPKPAPEGTGFVEYKIKPGDTLSQIFYRHFGVKKIVLFDERLRLFRKINPDLDNINRIHSGQIIRMPIDTASGTSHEDPAGSLEKIALLLQARLVRKGLFYFPMPGKADFKLDLAQFPLMEFSDGLRILFNPDKALTQDDRKVIHHYWPDLKISEVSYDATYQEILEQVLNVAPYLNDLIEKKQQASAPESLQTTSPSSSILPTGRYVPVHGRQQLIETLMQILGVSYTKNIEISFPYAGVQISSRVNLIESGKGKPILVDFGSFYGDAVQALEKAGFIVIQILDADSVYDGVSMLLDALAVSYAMDSEIQMQDQPPLKIPGIWIKKNGLASLILTEAILNHEMIQAIQEKGIIIITEKGKTG